MFPFIPVSRNSLLRNFLELLGDRDFSNATETLKVAFFCWVISNYGLFLFILWVLGMLRTGYGWSSLTLFCLLSPDLSVRSLELSLCAWSYFGRLASSFWFRICLGSMVWDFFVFNLGLSISKFVCRSLESIFRNWSIDSVCCRYLILSRIYSTSCRPIFTLVYDVRAAFCYSSYFLFALSAFSWAVMASSSCSLFCQCIGRSLVSIS